MLVSTSLNPATRITTAKNKMPIMNSLKGCSATEKYFIDLTRVKDSRTAEVLRRIESGNENATRVKDLERLPFDVWNIQALNAMSNERTGSPDQKPLALYERIIKASSNEGDLVLDPFYGCATTIIAANNLNRRWIGIDRRKDARYHIITSLMGIDRKERGRLEKYAIDKEWLDKQNRRYEMHYQTEPPKRTDEAKQTSPKLAHVYSTETENPLSHAEMHEILVTRFGLKCWGCNFIPPDKRYLHLDHIIPKTDGGTNHIDNRALICQPCNTKKSNTMSLTALRRENKQEEYIQPYPSIDLQEALAWTKNYSIQIIRETPYQLEIDNSHP